MSKTIYVTETGHTVVAAEPREITVETSFTDAPILLAADLEADEAEPAHEEAEVTDEIKSAMSEMLTDAVNDNKDEAPAKTGRKPKNK